VKTPSWQATSGIGSHVPVYLCVSELGGGVAATRLRSGGLLVAPEQVQDQGTSGPVVTIMESVVVAERPANPSVQPVLDDQSAQNCQNQAMKRHAGVMDPFPWRPPV
jgi:hypothetical protein